MNKIKLYILEAYNELLYKVTWPTWKELQSSGMIVLVATIMIAIAVLLMDQVSSNVLKFIYKLIVGA